MMILYDFIKQPLILSFDYISSFVNLFRFRYALMGYESFMFDILMTEYRKRDLSWINIINYIFMTGGLCSIYKQNFVEFLVEIPVL